MISPNPFAEHKTGGGSEVRKERGRNKKGAVWKKPSSSVCCRLDGVTKSSTRARARYRIFNRRKCCRRRVKWRKSRKGSYPTPPLSKLPFLLLLLPGKRKYMTQHRGGSVLYFSSPTDPPLQSTTISIANTCFMPLRRGGVCAQCPQCSQYIAPNVLFSLSRKR